MGQTRQESETVWAKVLVDYPGASDQALDTYIYRVPSELKVSSGDIVSVPFGARQVGGIVISTVTRLPRDISFDSIKPIENILSNTLFNKEYWQLLNRVEDYYQTPLIKIVKAALPSGLLSKSQRRVRLCTSVSKEALRLARQQSQLSESAVLLVDALRNSTEKNYSWQYLKRQIRSPKKTGTATAALSQLLRLGWVESYLVTPRSPQPQKRQAVPTNRFCAFPTLRSIVSLRAKRSPA